MSDFTVPELEIHIAAWKACLLAISHAQEYSIGARRFTKADLKEVRDTYDWYVSKYTQKISGQSSGPVFSTGRIRRS